MKSNQDKIFELERKISDLKYLERNLLKDRDIARMSSLDRAEKSAVVEKIIKNVFVTTLKADRKNIVLYSYPSRFNGRNNEEFLSEVRVDIRYVPEDSGRGYSEITMSVYVDRFFQDDAVQAEEAGFMDRLVELRHEVERLKDAKRNLKEGS